MKFLTWNIEFWRRISIEYKTKDEINERKEFVKILIQTDVDFILLQEINPFYVLGKQYNKRQNEPFYNFEYENKHIYYHELSDVLLKENPKGPFWVRQ